MNAHNFTVIYIPLSFISHYPPVISRVILLRLHFVLSPPFPPFFVLSLFSIPSPFYPTLSFHLPTDGIRHDSNLCKERMSELMNLQLTAVYFALHSEQLLTSPSTV